MHQIFIDETTNEMILFLPSINHQADVLPPKLNKQLQKSLADGFDKKADQANKPRKRRSGKQAFIKFPFIGVSDILKIL